MDEVTAAAERRTGVRMVVVGVLVALFGSGLYGLGRAQGQESPTPATTDEPAAAVAEALAPSVVRIEHASGQGSGVVYAGGGLVLTAGHVVDGVPEVTIRTAEDETITGEVRGIDPATDIAVVDAAEDLPVPELGSDDDLRVGQLAVAIGSPYGLDESVTMGIVSALDRSVTTQAGTIDGLIQTDAPINPGNSGGPLADKDGRVIGINHAIASSSGGNEGVGFAIPVGVALDSAADILSGEIEGGEPETGFLPELPYPDGDPFGGGEPFGDMEPFDGLEPFGGLVPGPGEGTPGRCLAPLPKHGFPDPAPFRDFEPPDVPLPQYLPSGWRVTGVMTNRTDDEGPGTLLQEIELVSGEEHMTITLGDAPELLERTETLEADEGAERETVDGTAATVVETGGRAYLVFRLDDLTGLVDAPAHLAAELARIAESIER